MDNKEFIELMNQHRKKYPIAWRLLSRTIGVSEPTLRKWLKGELVGFIPRQKIENYLERNAK